MADRPGFYRSAVVGMLLLGAVAFADDRAKVPLTPLQRANLAANEAEIKAAQARGAALVWRAMAELGLSPKKYEFKANGTFVRRTPATTQP